MLDPITPPPTITMSGTSARSAELDRRREEPLRRELDGLAGRDGCDLIGPRHGAALAEAGPQLVREHRHDRCDDDGQGSSRGELEGEAGGALRRERREPREVTLGGAEAQRALDDVVDRARRFPERARLVAGARAGE